MVSPEAIVAITKQRRLDSHELSYKSDASSHFLAPGARGRTQNASSGSFYREHMGQSFKQRPIEGMNGAPANHRATRKIVSCWLAGIYKITTCSVKPNWCHRARAKILIIWVSSMYICALCAVICLRGMGNKQFLNYAGVPRNFILIIRNFYRAHM